MSSRRKRVKSSGDHIVIREIGKEIIVPQLSTIVDVKGFTHIWCPKGNSSMRKKNITGKRICNIWNTFVVKFNVKTILKNSNVTVHAYDSLYYKEENTYYVGKKIAKITIKFTGQANVDALYCNLTVGNYRYIPGQQFSMILARDRIILFKNPEYGKIYFSMGSLDYPYTEELKHLPQIVRILRDVWYIGVEQVRSRRCLYTPGFEIDCRDIIKHALYVVHISTNNLRAITVLSRNSIIYEYDSRQQTKTPFIGEEIVGVTRLYDQPITQKTSRRIPNGKIRDKVIFVKGKMFMNFMRPAVLTQPVRWVISRRNSIYVTDILLGVVILLRKRFPMLDKYMLEILLTFICM